MSFLESAENVYAIVTRLRRLKVLLMDCVTINSIFSSAVQNYLCLRDLQNVCDYGSSLYLKTTLFAKRQWFKKHSKILSRIELIVFIDVQKYCTSVTHRNVRVDYSFIVFPLLYYFSLFPVVVAVCIYTVLILNQILLHQLSLEKGAVVAPKAGES